jgi:hypothetical protein
LTAEQARTTRPLGSTRITRLPSYYETVRPCTPRRYAPPHGFSRLRFSLQATSRRPQPLHWPAAPSGYRFTRSAREPRPRSRHLHAGHRLANQQAPARLIPGHERGPGFDVTYLLSTLHQWFACARLRDPHLPRSRARLFPRRSPPRLLTAAARGGLRPPPTRRPRRATRPTGPAPPSLAQHRSSEMAFYIHPPSRSCSHQRRHCDRPDPAARPAARTIGFVRLRARSPGPPSAHYGRSAEQFPSGFRWPRSKASRPGCARRL